MLGDRDGILDGEILGEEDGINDGSLLGNEDGLCVGGGLSWSYVGFPLSCRSSTSSS